MESHHSTNLHHLTDGSRAALERADRVEILPFRDGDTVFAYGIRIERDGYLPAFAHEEDAQWGDASIVACRTFAEAESLVRSVNQDVLIETQGVDQLTESSRAALEQADRVELVVLRDGDSATGYVIRIHRGEAAPCYVHQREPRSRSRCAIFTRSGMTDLRGALDDALALVRSVNQTARVEHAEQ
ncbi:hypothetical protein L0E83_08880 [Marichromatium gracile]|uniref:hypothetical protein n=1 Tax=Marichromatium gracile TaxID=1048 RepID=UPI001F1DE5DA|nr:hypothetical protein [Marichromatium gracile]MCF1183549.1 hypothetical protein [Marichromatium gracile]